MRRTFLIILAVQLLPASCQQQGVPDRPVRTSARRPEVVFFHGMYPPEEAPEVLGYREEFVRRAAARGVRVYSPDGRQGLCSWQQDFADHICWPTSPFQRAEAGEILAPFRALDPPPVLVGHSNGGFFAVRVVEEELQPVSALVVLHAGGVGKLAPRDHPPPTLLVAASDDSFHCPRMMALDEELTAVGWPHQFTLRPGKHAFTLEDMDTVLDFLARTFPTGIPP